MNRFLILLSVLGLSLLKLNAWTQCPNDNTFYETKAAPTVVGNSITTELYGGEYSRITGLVAGKTYRISNCGDNAFDSEITIYQTGATGAIAYNDDYEVCAPQSVIYFTPPVSGDYDIVVDEYNCVDNFVAFTTVTVELFDEPRQVITIPTVVHVVYNTSTQNISDAQINSQIDVLNADFRRLNTDIGITPVRFYGFSKDLRIEFCLASLDPVGATTTGITRTFTNRTGFDPSDDFMKFDADGGKNAWPRDQYMNIWVCDVEGSTLGFAQFPGEPAPTDGVVIDYESFGTTGTATPPFNLGRTATHEVGHWLNLKHIWGDDGTGCSGSDEVNDTPNQGGSNGGCTTAPVSCSNGGLGGDMYVNYMDYSDDACLTMFTYWQYRRTEAALLGPRSGLLSSPGCGAISSAPEMGAASLLVTVYPNPASDAISVRLEGDYQKVKGLRFVITDLQGQKVIAREAGSATSFEVDVSGLAKGIYLYQIIGDDNRFATGKLAVQ